MLMSLTTLAMAAQGKPMRLERAEKRGTNDGVAGGHFTKGENMSQEKCQCTVNKIPFNSMAPAILQFAHL